MNNEELWKEFLSRIQLITQPFTYNTWFKTTKLLRIDNSTCVIKVDTDFQKDFLSKNYSDLMSETLSSITNVNYDFEFVLEENREEVEVKEELFENKNNEKSLEISHKKLNSNLNPKYTFENFVVGDTNRFASTTARAVAENPGKIYNPLFIYGKSGLGKTHLMHAIGNQIANNLDKAVLYVTSNEFISDFTNIYRKDKKQSPTLLYSTGNYIQYPMINHNGKGYEK